MRIQSYLFAAGIVLALGAGSAWAQSGLGNYPGPSVNSRANPGIASGSHSGFYIRMAEDMATICAKGSTPFRLNVVATQGGLDSVKRLRNESEVQLAIVQSDLWYFAKRNSEASSGTAQSAEKRKSWAAMADDIRILLPLYTEKIHIVVKPYGKNEYKDLMGLFRNRARVNVGTTGSGTMITCSMIEEMMLREMRSMGEPMSTWQPVYLPADAALERLVEGGDVDAVILVGGVPYPALEKFGIEQAKKPGGIFNRTNTVAELALLPIGDDANRAFDRNPDFKGYVKTTIKADAYEFLTGEKNDVETRGVTACLVTHKAYSGDPKASAESRAKLAWVQHILARTLTNLDQGSKTGLNREIAGPQAGELWVEVWENISRMQKGELSWGSYGWARHDDPTLRRLVDDWTSRQDIVPAVRLINPEGF